MKYTFEIVINQVWFKRNYVDFYHLIKIKIKLNLLPKSNLLFSRKVLKFNYIRIIFNMKFDITEIKAYIFYELCKIQFMIKLLQKNIFYYCRKI